MTKIEVYDERNSKKKSFIIKLVIWKIFLNAFMPIFNSFYFYTFGQFDEFTPEWYRSKGINIQITSYLRIFSLMGVGFFRYLKPRFRAWYDRKFTSDKKITRKLTYLEYQKVYTFRQFDIELSYAEACTSIFVALCFGFMFPNIYIACLLQLVVLYYKDKLLGNFFPFIIFLIVVNTYIFLSIFDKRNHQFMRNILILASFTSSVLCIWTFGNKDYFPDNLLTSQINNFFDISKSLNTTEKNFYFEQDLSNSNSIHPGDFIDLIHFTKYREKEHNPIKEKYPDYYLESSSGQYWYFSLLMERVGNSTLAKVIIFIILSFFTIQILRSIFKKVKKNLLRKKLKKGIKHYKDQTSEIHFEDLIKDEEILDMESMWRIMRGRETNVKRLDKMNEERIVRLKRVWRRRSRRNTLRRANSILSPTKLMAKGVLRFSTLANYDFKVLKFFFYFLIFFFLVSSAL